MDTLHTVLRSIRGETKSPPRPHLACSANSSITSIARRARRGRGRKASGARAATERGKQRVASGERRPQSARDAAVG